MSGIVWNKRQGFPVKKKTFSNEGFYANYFPMCTQSMIKEIKVWSVKYFTKSLMVILCQISEMLHILKANKFNCTGKYPTVMDLSRMEPHYN